jgi:hypothetical protein
MYSAQLEIQKYGYQAGLKRHCMLSGFALNRLKCLSRLLRGETHIKAMSLAKRMLRSPAIKMNDQPAN